MSNIRMLEVNAADMIVIILVNALQINISTLVVLNRPKEINMKILMNIT